MPFILSTKDTYRQAVEAATDGKNTVMYDDKGNPSVMVVIPRFNLADVIDGAPDTPHPAFIVNGVTKSEIYISKFQNVVHDGRAYSLPGMDPKTNIDFDQAKQYCSSKNGGENGWHLMTNAEWAAIALWCKKNESIPRGNNDYGKDHSASYERGRETSTSNDQTGRIATGSGPASWSHDGTNAGIFDLNGNVWEWNDGLKLIDGKIYVHKDNDYDTPGGENVIDQWVDTGASFDDINGLVLNSENTAGEVNPSSITFESLSAADGFTIPDLLNHLAIAPISGDYSGDNLYANLEGERVLRRGGHWRNGSDAGVFSAHLNNGRSRSHSRSGFRCARIL